MAQKVNALPDINREDNTPQVTGYIPAKDMGGDVSLSDSNRNSALPDANQDRVLPTVQVSTGSPLMTDGRYETPDYVGNKGNQPLPNTEFAVGPQSVNTSTEFLRDNSKNPDKLNTI